MVSQSSKSDIRRTRLMAAGRTAFGQNGLYATRIEEITELAGVAKGTFYLYFEGKEDLIRAIAGEAFRQLGDACERAGAPAATWQDRVAALSRAHLQFFAEDPASMRILHQLRGMLTFELPEWQPLRATLQSHVDALATLLGASPAPELLNRETALGLARVLFGAVSGSVSVWIACEGPDSPVPQEALISALLAFATAFIGGHRSEPEGP
jgi:AcrR family transcriptional regulator